MAWAGVNSENLASIWLLYHLTDKLDPDRVKALAKALDLARRPGEGIKEYRTRIQKAGVLPTRSRVPEALFLMARRDVMTQVASSPHPEDELALSSLVYGWGHAGELAKVQASGGRARATRERALSNSYRHLDALSSSCETQHQALVQAVQYGSAPAPSLVPDLWVQPSSGRVAVACGAPPTGYVRPDTEALGAVLGAGAADRLRERLRRPTVGSRIRDLFGGGAAQEPPRPSPVASWEDVLLDDRVHVSTFVSLQAATARRRALVTAGEIDLYDPDLLYWHQDFRVLLSLRYVSEMARQYGVRSDIRPVLSIPLGASEITLEEATAVYGGLVSGEAWSFPGTAASSTGVLSSTSVASPPDSALLIAEIRDVDGRVLYRAKPVSRRVGKLSNGSMTFDILRNVVQHGTGRRALSSITVDGTPVPVGGKTGTTNDFKNAAFLGVIPKWYRGAWRSDHGYVIGTYVGYDDNRPMSKGRTRLAGASGALPAWISAAQGLAEAGLLGEPSPPPEGGWVVQSDSGLTRVPVDSEGGLPLPNVDAGATSELEVLVPSRPVDPWMELRFESTPRPTRIAPSTSEAADRAQRRRRMLEQLRDRPPLWDELEGRP